MPRFKLYVCLDLGELEVDAESAWHAQDKIRDFIREDVDPVANLEEYVDWRMIEEVQPGMEIQIEDVFTIKPTKQAPQGGHVILCRPDRVPREGQTLTQGKQTWSIIGVQAVRDGCFGPHKPGHNVGVLVPRNLPQPTTGPAKIGRP